MRRVLLLVALLAGGAPVGAFAQHEGHMGHDMSAMPADGQEPAAQPRSAPDVQTHDHAHMGHEAPAMPAMDMNMDMDKGPAGTDLPARDAAPPSPPVGWAADGIHGAQPMARVREQMLREHGGGTFSQIIFDLAEYRANAHGDSAVWEGEAWVGGDINRLVVKSEGEAALGERIEHAEVQMLYSRAIGPYFDLQAGVRHDMRPGPSRSYATIGVEGLAPYWFDVEAALFLSDKGDVSGRIEASYDQRISQRLFLQPRLEANVAAQDVPEHGVGAGLVDGELGLRLRYEIAREFAPYVGFVHEWRFGETARLARMAGERRSTSSFVAGVRFWF